MKNPTEITRLFKGLEALKAACGPTVTKHDLVTVLIKACIDDGVNTGSQIVGTLRHLGCNPRHVGRWLKMLAGNNPKQHHWQRGEDGIYRHLEPVT